MVDRKIFTNEVVDFMCCTVKQKCIYYIKDGVKLQAVKHLREYTGLGLRDCKRIVDMWVNELSLNLEIKLSLYPDVKNMEQLDVDELTIIIRDYIHSKSHSYSSLNITKTYNDDTTNSI